MWGSGCMWGMVTCRECLHVGEWLHVGHGYM